jgi:hypothetical protein
MPKVDNPLFGEDATGSVAKMINFTNQWGWAIVRGHRRPGDRETPARLDQRAAFRAHLDEWRSLSDQDKTQWRSLTPEGLTVINFYLKSVFDGLTLADFPAPYSGATTDLESLWQLNAWPGRAWPDRAFPIPFH